MYKIIIIGGCESRKTNSLFNLIGHQPDIDKINLYDQDLYKVNLNLFIKRWEETGLAHFIDSKVFVEYSNNMDDVFKNFEKYNSNKKHKMLIVFDDMIADMLSNKNFNQVICLNKNIFKIENRVTFTIRAGY